MFQASGNTYQYVTLSVYYTHKHISVTKFVNSNKQPQTFVYAYDLLVLGLNRGSPSEEKTSMKKHFVHSLMGHLIEAARLLLDVSCFCADIILFIMVQHFVHSHYISYGTVKSMYYTGTPYHLIVKATFTSL